MLKDKLVEKLISVKTDNEFTYLMSQR